jgi:hypothetical protein
MEHWSVGVMEYWDPEPNTLALQYSTLQLYCYFFVIDRVSCSHLSSAFS